MYDNSKCCIDFEKKVHLNTEKLKLEKKESEKVFEELLIRMRELSQNECTNSKLLAEVAGVEDLASFLENSEE